VSEREQEFHLVVGSGASFGSNPLRQEIGLGKAGAIERVEIFWPATGVTQLVVGLEIDRFCRISEGEAEATKLELKSFKWPAALGAKHALQARRVFVDGRGDRPQLRF
jgi:hypothetical protein